MKIIPTEIPDVLLLEPRVFPDPRGFFLESFNSRTFTQTTSLAPTFVQDNHSRSTRGVLRGLHYQLLEPQGKLLRVSAGEIFDVAVDIRRSSPTFGKYVTALLSDQNHRSIWIPPGFAHGFLVLSATADVLYKTTAYYAPAHERTILWNDVKLNIPWPLTDIHPILSEKDRSGIPLAEAELYV